MESLREGVMINQFVQVTGATRDQAVSALSSSKWQLQSALSTYLEESLPPPTKQQGSSLSFMTPANTPATPPHFADTLSLFSTLSTSGANNIFSSSSAVMKFSGSKFTFSPRQSLSPRQTFSPPSHPVSQAGQEEARHNFLVPQLPAIRTRHDSEVQGGGRDHAAPGRGASCLSNTCGMEGVGQARESQEGGWRNNNQEMEEFEMEMDD